MTDYKDLQVGDRFRFGTSDQRDEAMRLAEVQPDVKCLAFNRDDEFWFRVIATEGNPGRPEDIREWLDEGMDEPVDQEKALYEY